MLSHFSKAFGGNQYNFYCALPLAEPAATVMHMLTPPKEIQAEHEPTDYYSFFLVANDYSISRNMRNQ
jgi:hypothetical protein